MTYQEHIDSTFLVPTGVEDGFINCRRAHADALEEAFMALLEKGLKPRQLAQLLEWMLVNERKRRG